MMCWAIWYWTLENGVLMVDQNAFLTSYNALEQPSEKNVSVNLFVWCSNSYFMFTQSSGMFITVEWHTNGISEKKSNGSIWKVF